MKKIPIIKKFDLDVVDEVYDCDDFLLVRNHGDEDHIQISNILNVNLIQMDTPRIIIKLRTPSKFGSEIIFKPIMLTASFSLNPFTYLFPKIPSCSVFEDLIIRVSSAKATK